MIYEGRELTADEFAYLLDLSKEDAEEELRNLQIYGEFKL